MRLRLSSIYSLTILAVSASSQLLTAPKALQDDTNQAPLVLNPLSPAMSPSDDSRPSAQVAQSGVLISDVMGRDRSINIFAGYARDIASVSNRFDDSGNNSTVLAPLNSAVEKLPRKPWEDPKEYDAMGANAYEGEDGQDRAHRNLRRFVEAHIMPVSPWPEKEKVKSLLDGDREIWWEKKDDVLKLQPDGIEIQSIASRVGNGEVWILKEARNYS
ncbi:hypothetical protein F5Y18DRAFT_296113 [Xylariaceae sp. FL1019]|nr:hypothetical protein F5Y18DRAFT_296113 [Xylariaceae sp. FL1019]